MLVTNGGQVVTYGGLSIEFGPLDLFGAGDMTDAADTIGSTGDAIAAGAGDLIDSADTIDSAGDAIAAGAGDMVDSSDTITGAGVPTVSLSRVQLRLVPSAISLTGVG